MNGLLLWIIIVLLILLIGFAATLVTLWGLMKEQANMIRTYKEIEDILNEKIDLLEEHIELLKS